MDLSVTIATYQSFMSSYPSVDLSFFIFKMGIIILRSQKFILFSKYLPSLPVIHSKSPLALVKLWYITLERWPEAQ